VPDPRYLEDVRRIVLDAMAPFDVEVYLYGSWATGQARRTSDIDVAIAPRAPLPTGTLARLRERLEESHVPYVVEVVDITETDVAFRERVTAEGRRWAG